MQQSFQMWDFEYLCDLDPSTKVNQIRSTLFTHQKLLRQIIRSISRVLLRVFHRPRNQLFSGSCNLTHFRSSRRSKNAVITRPSYRPSSVGIWELSATNFWSYCIPNFKRRPSCFSPRVQNMSNICTSQYGDTCSRSSPNISFLHLCPFFNGKRLSV